MANMTKEEYIAFQKKTIAQARSIYDKAIAFCPKVFEPGIYTNFLSFMAKWHHFFSVNALLIYMQRPDASYITDIKNWNRLAKEQGLPDDHINIPQTERNKGIALLIPFSFNDIEKPQNKGPHRFLTFKTIVAFDIAQVNQIKKPQGTNDYVPIAKLDFAMFLTICRYEFQESLSFSPGPVNDKGFRFQAAYLKENRIIYQGDAPDEKKIAAILKEIIRYFTYEKCPDELRKEYIYLSTIHAVFEYLRLPGEKYSFPDIRQMNETSPEELFYMLDMIHSLTVFFIYRLHHAYQYFKDEFSDGDSAKLIKMIGL